MENEPMLMPTGGLEALGAHMPAAPNGGQPSVNNGGATNPAKPVISGLMNHFNLGSSGGEAAGGAEAAGGGLAEDAIAAVA